ncbi:MAG: hypothetical protein L0Z62_04020 [Gemmataceae bacterium]|nr:hypothetical protein [Gemmataceae bacterium]
MALPLPPNTTCDVYRNGNSPPSSPDVASVPGHLTPAFRAGMEINELALTQPICYTHVLLVDASTDIRDAYTGQRIFMQQDTVYVPDQNGTAFRVMFVERVNRGLASDHKRVYLDRLLPTWPTNDL